MRETIDQSGIVAAAFILMSFNGVKDRAERIEQFEKRRDHLSRGGQLAVSKKPEKILAGVRKLLKNVDTRETPSCL